MYFIIGASSFIGRHLYNYCIENKIEVLGTYYKNSYCDQWVQFNACTDSLYDLCSGYLDNVSFHAIIFCSAISSIDECKKDESASNDLNVSGMKRLIGQADQMGVMSVFLSSEAVFDGKKGMYTEQDIPNPITIYGMQKLEIEQYIKHNIKNYLIFRISRAVGKSYGEDDIFGDFYDKVIHNEEIVCLKNQCFCLTEVNDIVKGMIGALDKGLNGLYHLSSNNYISRYALAVLYVKKVFGQYEKVVEKEYKDIPFADGRHILGGLNGDKLAGILQLNYLGVDEILDNYKYSYNKSRIGIIKV